MWAKKGDRAWETQLNKIPGDGKANGCPGVTYQRPLRRVELRSLRSIKPWEQGEKLDGQNEANHRS